MNTTAESTVLYEIRKGVPYEIRFVGVQKPNRHAWFLYDIKHGGTSTRRGVRLLQASEEQMRRWGDFSDESLAKLMWVRIAIALERAESDNTATPTTTRPDMDFGYAFTLPESVNSIAAAAAEMAAALEKSRRPSPIGFNQPGSVAFPAC
jgi:hypothetical protein